MKIERPQFELTRVFADGTSEAPEIIRVGCMPWDARMERRGFLGVGVGVAAVVCLLGEGADAKELERWIETQDTQPGNLSTKAPSESVLAHLYSVEGLGISPNGKTLVSVGNDSMLRTWALPGGRMLLRRKIMSDDDTPHALAIAPDGRAVIVAYSPNRLRAWSLPALSPLGGFLGLKEDEAVNALAVAPNNLLVAAATDEKEIRLWSWPGRRVLGSLKGHAGNPTAIAITPDSSMLVSASADNTVKLWSLADRRLLATLEGHTGEVNALAISHDGRLLVSSADDKSVQLWSLPEGKKLGTLKETAGAGSLALNPDDRLFTSGSDALINMRSLPEGKLQAALEAHTSGPAELAVTPDGKFLVSGHSDGAIIIWDLAQRSFRTFLFDRAANEPETKGVSYNVYDKVSGQTITYTLPCGSKVPRGAVCTCNCVPGTYREPSSGGGGGSYCICNKVCTCIPVPSDREVKEAFETTDPLLILQKLSELPIESWNYKWNNASIRHIGPMAQDFAAAFAVGEDDKHIHPVDAQGVAFAAIQGLYRIIKEEEARTESLQAQLRRQEEKNETLSHRIEALERLVKDAAVGRGGRARI